MPLTSAIFAFLGAALSLPMTSSLGLLRRRNALIWASSASLLFWFGTSPVGWFGLSVRPDLGAVCLAALGLLLSSVSRQWMIKDDRIATLIQMRRFHSLFLTWNSYISLALQNGYKSVGPAPGGYTVLSLDGSDAPASNR